MKLVFVYQADSGRWNAVLDSAHKLLRPETYECALCQLTHGTFGEKKAWKAFREESGLPMEFLHRDQVPAGYGPDLELPVILKVADGDPEVLLTAAEIGACADVETLIDRIRARVEE